MLYNVRIFGKRYKNKSIPQIIEIVERNADNVNLHIFRGVEGVRRDLIHVNSNTDKITRHAWYDFCGYVCFSINKVKEK